MNSKIIELELKIKELEKELANQKAETFQALSFVADKFSDELQKIMDDYKQELRLEFTRLYKQH